MALCRLGGGKGSSNYFQTMTRRETLETRGPAFVDSRGK